LPTNLLNRFGYNIEYDNNNTYQSLQIDFESIAAHVAQLHKQATKSGHDLWRVILAPELQPYLHKTEFGTYLKKHVQFTKKRSWVRHDDHYHVDFAVACR